MNVKLEEIYDAMVWVFMTVRQTSKLIIFLMTSAADKLEYSPFDQMIHIEQGKSLWQIVSIVREEYLQKIVSGISDPHVILQNLSEEDILVCFNSKDLID